MDTYADDGFTDGWMISDRRTFADSDSFAVRRMVRMDS